MFCDIWYLSVKTEYIMNVNVVYEIIIRFGNQYWLMSLLFGWGTEFLN